MEGIIKKQTNRKELKDENRKETKIEERYDRKK